jgi:phosphoribosylanthranilate isomerase
VTRIKLCGITRPADAAALNEALPDFAGFVFAESSRRRVTPAQAAALRRLLDPRIVTVGVFVDQPLDLAASLVQDEVIDLVQFHGTETAADIAALKAMVTVPVIKAVSVTTLADVTTPTTPDPENPADPAHPADCLLFDHGKGGTGHSFDLDLIRQAKAAGTLTSKPFFIAGGLNESNLPAALALNPYGVDISSGAETNGQKDPTKIAHLVALVTK